MLKLERGDKMTKAIERAKAVRPFVKWLGGRTYTVTSRDGQRVYTVRFVVANGHKLAECNCKAGVEGMLCYHVASAAAVNIAVASTRQRTASPAPQAEAVNPRAASVASPEQPSNIPAAAHTHNCQACGRHFDCDFTEFCWVGAEVVCDSCLKAGNKVWDAPRPAVPQDTVFPPQVSNGLAVRAC